MPTTVCPKCNRYSTVPNVQNAEPYRCPYCTTPEASLLYKCFSCMKVSIFVAARLPRACPYCMTIVRTLPRDVIPTPVIVTPFVETDWLYHVTSMTIARSIKRIGLQSALSRTGVARPDPNGSFALDRVNRVAKSIKGRLKEYLGVCLGNVDSNVWRDAVVPYTAFPFVCTGSNDDYVPLKRLEDVALTAFGNAVMGAKFQLKPKNKFVIAKKETTRVLCDLLATNADHYLTKLATQYANFDFDIEGAITACHVYFLNTRLDPLIFQGGFTDYTKLRSPSSIVVLRVRRADVHGAEDDLADFRAVRTRVDVPPARLEILTGTAIYTDFKRFDFRSRAENWTPLLQWR
ncbi:hypothetical protein [Trinickia acidisoli]|uniref:hypothetical protein n=1 Tax=Trinickia acidisoli TaxID=2767482 RepID=UPI001A90A175|nr:hypothetical protein [Trinickia acidisoli]